jgi:murein DD-endopeptidase MepM/ murein hydrolase activator NlpD
MSRPLRRMRRRRTAEAVAPWVTLSIILIVWWAAARSIGWFQARAIVPGSFTEQTERSGGDLPVIEPARGGGIGAAADVPVRDAAHPLVTQHDLADLRARHLLIPVRAVLQDSLVSSFQDARTGHTHEAIDIMAPRGTAVLAVENGTVARFFTSVAGGLTIYQFDPSNRFVYYYAHLDGYAPDLKEGDTVLRGQILGYVGTTGNAPKDTPHLHFGISKLASAHQWWGGTALDPFLVFKTP